MKYCGHCGEPMSPSPLLSSLCDKCTISAGFIREFHENLVGQAEKLLGESPAQPSSSHKEEL